MALIATIKYIPTHATFDAGLKKMSTRTEKDFLGTLEVPADAYYGIFTERAMLNFRISGLRADRDFIRALALIKKAAASANIELGLLDKRTGEAIIAAADEVANGKWDREFPLDVFQAGAGTPFNMNCNEVIANIAIEKLGGKKGEYTLVHPNNQVNMAQSSNDVIPTAIRIAVLFSLQPLTAAIGKLASEFRKKSGEYCGIVKTGRTHLEDAVPVRFDQVFNSYAKALDDCSRKIKAAEDSLLQLGLGGTAVGTGINTHPQFKEKATNNLSKYTGFKFSVAADSILTTWSAAPFLEASNSLRLLATEVVKICNDLMLLNSGPKTAIAEIILPEVEPGSSIMPGKVNPSVPECAIMVCYQVLGNDYAVAEAAKSGQMELNVMTPLIAFDLLWSARIMANALNMLDEFCVSGLVVDAERSQHLLEKGLSLVTALNPYIGYEAAAEVVKITLKEGKPLTAVILENKIIDEQDLVKVLDAKAMTEPRLVDKELQTKIQSSEAFRKFKQLRNLK